MEPVITVKNLSKIFRLYSSPKARLIEAFNPFGKEYHTKFQALDDISFEAYKGEVLGIVGRNGSGKSTLLKIIAGVIAPTSGSVEVHGKVSPLLELGTGMNPKATGLQNIQLLASIMGVPKEGFEELKERILSFADIDADHINQPVRTYSSGMRARLGFSISTQITPEILILDEVLSVGDSAFKRKCYSKMEELIGGGTTVLFVSHSDQRIVTMCKRALLLDKGEMLAFGPSKMVVSDYLKLAAAKKKNQAKLKVILRKKLQGGKMAGLVASQIDAAQNKETAKSDVVTPFMNPDFVSKAKRVIKQEGAELLRAGLYSQQEREVNNILPDEEYSLNFVTQFEEAHDSVIFTATFANIQGVDLFHAYYPLIPSRSTHLADSPFSVEAGREYEFSFSFKNILHPGDYVVHLKIQKIIEVSDRKTLFNMRDAYMFRIWPTPLTMKAAFFSAPGTANVVEV